LGGGKIEKQYNCYLQESTYDCGVASLLTIFNNLGLKVSREKIITLLNIETGGISAYDLIKVSKHYGIDAKGVKGNIKMIKNENLPCICHTIKDKSLYHYIVILEKKKNSVEIMDPASGIEEVSINYLEEISTGIFILFDKPNNKIKKDKRFKKVLLKICKENKRLIVISIIFSIIFIFITLAFNYYIKLILSYFNSENRILLLIFITFLTLCLIKNAIEYIKDRITLQLNKNIDASITKQVIEHILNLPYTYFIKKTTGELTSITSDIENFKDIIIKIFIICTVDIILLMLVVLYLAFFGYIYLFLVIVLLLSLIYIALKFQYNFNNKYLNLKSARIKFSSQLIDNFTSYDTIKNLHIEKETINQLNNRYQEVISANKNYHRQYCIYDILINFSNEIFYLWILFISSTTYFKVEALNLVLLSSLFLTISNLIKDIADNISLYKMYETSVIKVLDILEIKKEVFIPSNLSEIDTIEFKNVRYKKDDKIILNNINFCIHKKEHTLIHGKSGIGKSTLMKLILRHINYTKGEILIDNLKIEDINLEFIRNNITYVSQNESLFIDTIENNLNIIDNGEENIKKALKTVLFNESIDVKTFVLEENGLNISGGERKKLILARALLKAKNILILDETFNEISEDEERLIIKNIKNNYQHLTMILITHRNSNKDLFVKEIKITEGGANERIKKA